MMALIGRHLCFLAAAKVAAIIVLASLRLSPCIFRYFPMSKLRPDAAAAVPTIDLCGVQTSYPKAGARAWIATARAGPERSRLDSAEPTPYFRNARLALNLNE